MRRTLFVVALLVRVVGFPLTGSAQDATRPVILNVTMDASGDQLTIVGTGFGPAPVVTIDGQPVPVLPGASDTQVSVVTPAALLTTPGTYRLTMVDSVRQLGEAFVVTSRAGLVPAVSLTTTAVTSAGGTTSATSTKGTGVGFAAGTSMGGGPVASAIEDSGSPYLTALGSGAGAATTGLDNTAVGFNSLATNLGGADNTAVGWYSLNANIAGNSNTAVGVSSLLFTTASENTAVGHSALQTNSTGTKNSGFGRLALFFNTTGANNTATGYEALYKNTTANYNTANGYQALLNNTTGATNTATGAFALAANTTSGENSAHGYGAMFLNVTGAQNTGDGAFAVYSNTVNDGNTGVGYRALYSNTGGFNTMVGHNAGANLTSGIYNVYLGAGILGTAAETGTIRIGQQYSGGVGQDRTFIAGIRGTTVAGYFPVVVDSSGQLGTAEASGNFGVGTSSPAAKLDVRVSGTAPASFSVVNTNLGGGAFGVNVIGGAIGSLVAGDALMQNGVGNIVFSPNAAGKQVRFIGGTWTNPVSMTVADGGNVGVGTTSPAAKLEVNTSGIAPPSFSIVNTGAGGGRFGVNVIGGAIGSLVAGDALMQNGVGNIVFSPNVAGKDVRFIGGLWTNPVSLVVKDGGNVGIGTLSPSFPLHMASGAYVSAGGVWTNASSRSLKNDIADLPLDRAMDAFERLKPVTFVYKASPGEAHVGFIAEDVPDLVATTDRKSLAAMDIVAVLTKVVQSQQDQLNAQAQQLHELAELRARLARLESRVADTDAAAK